MIVRVRQCVLGRRVEKGTCRVLRLIVRVLQRINRVRRWSVENETSSWRHYDIRVLRWTDRVHPLVVRVVRWSVGRTRWPQLLFEKDVKRGSKGRDLKREASSERDLKRGNARDLKRGNARDFKRGATSARDFKRGNARDFKRGNARDF